MPRHFDWLTASLFAHRGLFDAAAHIPENSLLAAKEAVKAGYGIECDVRLSQDGVAIVFHDQTLERLTAREGCLASLTANTLKTLTLQESRERIPDLATFLLEIGGKVPLLIEVKIDAEAPIDPIMKAVSDAIQGYQGAVAVMSFDPRVVYWLKAYQPYLCRGLVAGAVALGFTRLGLALPEILRRSQPDFIACDHRMLPHPVLSRWRRAERPLLSWTVRTQAEQALVKRHADAPIFERPAYEELA